MFKVLYGTDVRQTTLGVYVQAWSSHYQRDIQQLENVQRKATYLVGFHGMSYENRLQKPGLNQLEKRRDRGDMIETFKILNRFENVES